MLKEFKETKARKIFRDTRYSCKKHLKNWGAQYNPDGKIVGFNHMTTEEVMSTRTFNDVQKVIENERTNLRLMRKFEVLGEEEYSFDNLVLDMVQSTLDNQIESERKFREWLKG